MDDIFQVLIWLFIIISFMSSFFKKKKKSQESEPQRYERAEEEFPVREQTSASVDKEEYNIMREIEGLFKADTSRPATIEKKESWDRTSLPEHEPASYEQRDDKYKSYDREQVPKIKRIESRAEYMSTPSEHFYEADLRKQREKAKLKTKADALVSKRADDFEKYLKRKSSGETLANIINRRMKQPSSLKEYIIISEILNKPKSLRR